MSQVNEDEGLKVLAQSILDEGGDATDLHVKNIPAEICLSMEFKVADLRQGGYKAEQLEEADVSAERMRDGGYDAADLREAHFDALRVRTAGYTGAEAKAGGYSVTEAKEGGYPIAEIHAGGWTAQEVKEAGFEPTEVMEAYTPDEVSGVYLAEDFFPSETATATQGLSLLTDSLEETETSLSHVNEVIENAKGAIDSAEGDIKSLFDEINAKLDGVEKALDDEGKEAKGDLDKLKGHLEDLETRVEESQQAVQQGLQQAETVSHQAAESIETDARETAAAQEKVHDQVVSLRQTTETQVTTEADRADQFKSTAGQHAAGITSHKDTATKELDDYRTGLESRMESLAGDFAAFSGALTKEREEAQSQASSEAGNRLQALDQLFGDEIVSRIGNEEVTAKEALASIGKAAEAGREMLDGEIGTAIEEASGLLDALEPVLDLVKTAKSIL